MTKRTVLILLIGAAVAAFILWPGTAVTADVAALVDEPGRARVAGVLGALFLALTALRRTEG